MAIPIERKLPLTLDLPSSLYREIGRVIAAHAAVEWAINRIVFQLLRITPVEGRIAVREPRTTDRLDMIVDLAQINKIEIQVNTKILKETLEKCYRDRDELAHGVWAIDREVGKLFLRLSGGKWQLPGTNKSIKRRIELEAREYTAAKAKETCRLIVSALTVLGDLEREIVAGLASLPEKYQLQSRGNRRRRDHASKKRPTPPGSSPR
jgi:hypothetical protein